MNDERRTCECGQGCGEDGRGGPCWDADRAAAPWLEQLEQRFGPNPFVIGVPPGSGEGLPCSSGETLGEVRARLGPPQLTFAPSVELPDSVFSKAEVIDLRPGSDTFGVRYRVEGPAPNVNIGGRGLYFAELDEPCDCDECYVEPTEAEVRAAERRLTGQGPV